MMQTLRMPETKGSIYYLYFFLECIFIKQ